MKTFKRDFWKNNASKTHSFQCGQMKLETWKRCMEWTGDDTGIPSSVWVVSYLSIYRLFVAVEICWVIADYQKSSRSTWHSKVWNKCYLSHLWRFFVNPGCVKCLYETTFRPPAEDALHNPEWRKITTNDTTMISNLIVPYRLRWPLIIVNCRTDLNRHNKPVVQ